MIRHGVAAIMVGVLAGSPVGKSAAASQQPGASATFTLKVQTDIVLTNVVVRDKKTGEVVKGLKAERLYRFWRMGSRRRSPASTIRTWTRPRCCGEVDGDGQGYDCRLVEQRLCGGPGRAEGSSADRDVLRPEQHAAGRHRPRGGSGAGLHQQEDAAGRPGRAGEHGHRV